MMKKTCILLLLFVSCAGTGWAQQKDVDEMIKKLEAARSKLSPAHQHILFEDFASTGVFAHGYIEAPADTPAGSGVTQPQGTAAENLAASLDLPDNYTVWIQSAGEWYVSVRKDRTAVFLKLKDAGGDMDFNRGSGWCIQPTGSGFAKYPYTDGKWGAAQPVSADAVQAAIDGWQQEFILTPAGDMGSDRVKLFEKAAYFDDLDIALPKN